MSAIQTQTTFNNDSAAAQTAATNYGPIFVVGATVVTRVEVQGVISVPLSTPAAPVTGDYIDQNLVCGVQHVAHGGAPESLGSGGRDVTNVWLPYSRLRVSKSVAQHFMSSATADLNWNQVTYEVDINILPQHPVPSAGEDWYFSVSGLYTTFTFRSFFTFRVTNDFTAFG